MAGPNEKGKQKPVTVHLSSMYSYFIMKIINNKNNKQNNNNNNNNKSCV